MLVRNVFENDFVGIVERSIEWGDLVIERDNIYHILCAHFRGTCFVAEDKGRIIGYLLGFCSQSRPGQAYMHLLHVDPQFRGHGVGQRLFSQFQTAVKAMDCVEIVAVSKPQNRVGMTFYTSMGLNPVAMNGMIEVDGVKAVRDYNGPGKHMVLWCKQL